MLFRSTIVSGDDLGQNNQFIIHSAADLTAFSFGNETGTNYTVSEATDPDTGVKTFIIVFDSEFFSPTTYVGANSVISTSNSSGIGTIKQTL